MIKLADHVEEIKEMIRNTTPEELTAFMRERGHDFTFEDPNKEDEPMTALDLTHLETLLAAATPGPWIPSNYGFQILTGDSWETICVFHEGPRKESKDHRLASFENGAGAKTEEANADLIAALRNAAPALIARVRELEDRQVILEKARLNASQIIASLATDDADLWQPIETAPKGDEIYMLAESGFVYFGFWSEGVGWVQCHTCSCLSPTHWKHLPKPPTE